MIFSYKQLALLNENEINIYRYIIQNIDEVKKMTIREIANKTYVSTSTILRFCQKMGCDGFKDFKDELQEYALQKKANDYDSDIEVLKEFSEYAQSEEFINNLEQCVEYIANADTRCIIGIGSSGELAHYGARYFSNVGYFTYAISDPFYPPFLQKNSNHLLIVLSESGETREVIDQIRVYQMYGVKVMAITNNPQSTINSLADISINYYVKRIVLPQTYNISTQIPVIYILEQITKLLWKKDNNHIPTNTSTI